MNFEDRLKDMTDADRDTWLAKIWADFRGSDAHQALVYTIQNFQRPALQVVLSPESPDSKRAFAAGMAHAGALILNLLQIVTNIDLSSLSVDTTKAEPGGEGESFIPKEEVPY